MDSGARRCGPHHATLLHRAQACGTYDRALRHGHLKRRALLALRCRHGPDHGRRDRRISAGCVKGRAMTETSETNQSLWLLTASPVIWAAHFMLSYITASIWCAKLAGPDKSLWEVR